MLPRLETRRRTLSHFSDSVQIQAGARMATIRLSQWKSRYSYFSIMSLFPILILNTFPISHLEKNEEKTAHWYVDFQSGSRLDRNVEMLMATERSLIQNRCFSIPSVYVRPEVEKVTAAKIKEVVRRHQGSIVEAEVEASHVVYPSVDPISEEYARPCMRRDRSVLLHWYYLPDSYDSWSTLDLPWDYPESTFGGNNSRSMVDT